MDPGPFPLLLGCPWTTQNGEDQPQTCVGITGVLLVLMWGL